jgi:hypothetical protein
VKESKALLELLEGQELTAEALLRVLDGLAAQFCQTTQSPAFRFQMIADMHGLVDRIEALLTNQDPFDGILAKIQKETTT